MILIFLTTPIFQTPSHITLSLYKIHLFISISIPITFQSSTSLIYLLSIYLPKILKFTCEKLDQ